MKNMAYKFDEFKLKRTSYTSVIFVAKRSVPLATKMQVTAKKRSDLFFYAKKYKLKLNIIL